MPAEAAERAALDRAIAARVEAMEKARFGSALRCQWIDRLRSLTDEALRAAFDKALTEGWKKTDNYGQETGQVVTLKTRVLDILNPRESYNNPVAKVFEEQVGKALKGEMGKLLEEATAKLRAMVDDKIAEKMRGALKDAFK